MNLRIIDAVKGSVTGKSEKMKEEQQEIYDVMENPDFIAHNQRAMSYIEDKIHRADRILKENKGRMVVSSVTGRIKTPESIIDKLRRKGKDITYISAMEHLNDIVGVRAVCLFTDDIYHLRQLFLEDEDIVLLKEKDFIKKPKNSGYQSLHLIIQVPSGLFQGDEAVVKAELQIRTAAMDYWSVLEYQLQYKKTKSKRVRQELKRFAMEVGEIDKKMFRLRNKLEDM